jgi:hypothetical protein
MKSAEATFSITGWEEHTLLEISSGAKITQAKVTQRYQGDLEATASIDYLMSYSSDGTAQFVGYETITGSIEDFRGSFVIQHIGTFANGIARSSWTVVKGAGTGDFVTLYGLGDYIAGHEGTAKVMFSYEC